jgi:hypothetical protein
MNCRASQPGHEAKDLGDLNEAGTEFNDVRRLRVISNRCLEDPLESFRFRP